MINEENGEQPPKAKTAELLEDVVYSIDSADFSEQSDDAEDEATSNGNRASEEDDDDSGEEEEGPLTKATVLTFSDMNSPWLRVGEGVVSVEVALESTGPAPPPPSSSATSGGKVGKAEPNELVSGLASQRVGRLVVVDLEDPDEIFLSTPIDVDGVYQARSDAVLMWEDAQLGRAMALKFSRQEGCDKVLHDIMEFQQSELAKKEAEAALQMDGMDSGTGSGSGRGNTPTTGGKAGGGAAAGQSASHKYSVSIANLPTIVDAVHTNPLVFGIYVREDMTYFRQLAAVFEESKERGDITSMERVAEITLSLLGSPYNSEGKILGQFMESAYVDKCVDIVQYALGRRDKASGFVSFEERRATFRDPMQLPAPILQRIHLLYSAMYLRDLLPLSLDDGDSLSPCVLNLLLLRFKFTLVSEICTQPELLQRAFEAHRQAASPDRDALYGLMAFVQDMSKMVKNAPIPLDMKEELFQSMIQDGLFPFCNAVLRHGLADVESASATTADAAAAAAAKAVEASCDVLSHCLFIVPTARESLLAESKESPSQCSLALVLRCLARMRNSSALQAAHDVVIGAAVGVQGLQLFQLSMGLGAQREITRFWIEGSGLESPPLFVLASHVASVLLKAKHPSEIASSASGAVNDEEEEQAIGTKPKVGGNTPRTSSSSLWSREEELQVVYAFRVLNAIAEKVEEGFCTSFAEDVRLSKILPAASIVMQEHRVRRLENVQSSIVSFITHLVTLGDGGIMKLLDGSAASEAEEPATGMEAGEGSTDSDSRHPPRSLLSVCMALYLTCSRRNTILSASLGALFVALCTEVHQEKLQLAEAAAAPACVPLSFVTLMDGSNPVSPDVADARREEAAQCRFQKAATALVELYGAQLEEQAPVMADRLRTSLRETPEEAKLAEAETASLPSTIGRPGDGLSDFDALAAEFGVDLPPPAIARSSSSSPISEAAAAAEDSLLSSLMDSSSSSSSASSASISESDEDEAEAQGNEEKVGEEGADKTQTSQLSTSVEEVQPPCLDDDSNSYSNSNSISSAPALGESEKKNETVASAEPLVAGRKHDREEDEATAEEEPAEDARPAAKKPKTQRRKR